jgi:hypothetical protein
MLNVLYCIWIQKYVMIQRGYWTGQENKCVEYLSVLAYIIYYIMSMSDKLYL